MATNIYAYNNELYTFQEFVLSEGVVPKQTKYGTNKLADNKRIAKYKNWLVTAFMGNNVSYVVTFNTNERTIGLGSYSGEFRDLDGENLKDSIEMASDKRTPAGNALKVFNKVFYVALRIAETKGFDEISFSGEDYKLHSLFSRIVKNKAFINYIENTGWRFSGEFKDNFCFRKVSQYWGS